MLTTSSLAPNVRACLTEENLTSQRRIGKFFPEILRAFDATSHSTECCRWTGCRQIEHISNCCCQSVDDSASHSCSSNEWNSPAFWKSWGTWTETFNGLNSTLQDWQRSLVLNSKQVPLHGNTLHNCGQSTKWEALWGVAKVQSCLQSKASVLVNNMAPPTCIIAELWGERKKWEMLTFWCLPWRSCNNSDWC